MESHKDKRGAGGTFGAHRPARACHTRPGAGIVRHTDPMVESQCASQYAIAPMLQTPSPACDFLSMGHCGGWDGVSLGQERCLVERLSQELDSSGTVRLHITSEGCGMAGPEEEVDAPFLYRLAEDDFIATVQISATSSVHWSEAGLLVVADDDPLDRLALHSVMGSSLQLTRTSHGSVERWPEPSAWRPLPWVRIQRAAGRISVHWRTNFQESWREMPGSPMKVLSALGSGRVRIGLTHQTSTNTVGAAMFQHFTLDRASGGGGAVASPMLSGAHWGPLSCLGERTMVFANDAHAEISAPCQLDRDDSTLSFWCALLVKRGPAHACDLRFVTYPAQLDTTGSALQPTTRTSRPGRDSTSICSIARRRPHGSVCPFGGGASSARSFASAAAAGRQAAPRSRWRPLRALTSKMAYGTSTFCRWAGAGLLSRTSLCTWTECSGPRHSQRVVQSSRRGRCPRWHRHVWEPVPTSPRSTFMAAS